MGKKVTIIGAGSVGSTIAYTMAVNGIATEVVMIDINEGKAMGEALDIRQGVAFCPPISIYAGSYQDAENSDIVILTSGVARKPGQSRLDLAQTNVNITKSIASQIVKYAPNAIYIIVANPVDILTYVFAKVSGLPEKQIIGSGTILDTARLRARLAEYYNISQQNVHAYVFGEHGDTSFVPWSMGTISNIAIDRYGEALTNKDFIEPKLVHEEVETYIRKSGGKIIQRKGATYYGIAMAVARIAECVMKDERAILPVSVVLGGQYGLRDLALSIPSIVGRRGAEQILEIPLSDSEREALNSSAAQLREVIGELELP